MAIDPNKIFGLFNDPPQDDEVGDIISTIVNIKDTPEYKIGMFTRIVMDHLQFNRKVIEFFSKADDDLEKEDIKNAGEFVVYNRAWFYIKDLDLEDKRTWYALEKMTSPKTQTALDLSINYFEELEEYEKCAHILKFSKASQEFLT